MYVKLTSIPRTIGTICNATYISDTWRLFFHLNAFCVSKVWAIKYFVAFEAQKKIFFLTLVSKFRPHSRSFKSRRIPINLFDSKFLRLSRTSLIFNWTLDKMNFTNEFLKSFTLFRSTDVFDFWFCWNYVCAVVHEEYNIRTHLFVICHRNIGMKVCSCLFCPEFFSVNMIHIFSNKSWNIPITRP